MALMVLAALVGIGLVSLALVVAAVRQNRDDAGVDLGRASLVDERAGSAATGGDAATDSSLARDARDSETSLTGYTLFI